MTFQRFEVLSFDKSTFSIALNPQYSTVQIGIDCYLISVSSLQVILNVSLKALWQLIQSCASRTEAGISHTYCSGVNFKLSRIWAGFWILEPDNWEQVQTSVLVTENYGLCSPNRMEGFRSLTNLSMPYILIKSFLLVCSLQFTLKVNCFQN